MKGESLASSNSSSLHDYLESHLHVFFCSDIDKFSFSTQWNKLPEILWRKAYISSNGWDKFSDLVLRYSCCLATEALVERWTYSKISSKRAGHKH